MVVPVKTLKTKVFGSLGLFLRFFDVKKSYVSGSTEPTHPAARAYPPLLEPPL